MREEFEKLVAAGKIARHHVEPLIQLASGAYCMHRSWGFGKITTVDTVFSRLTIDFEGKPGHGMDLGFAAESLKPIPADHILARKAADIAALRQMAALHHLDLIKMVLQSFGGKATLEQIQQVLVPDVIADDWKKWWEVAKRELKKDGHFLVPTKKSEPIVYQSKEVPLQDRIMGEFRAAKGLKARLGVAADLLKSLGDLTDPKAAVTEAVATLNAEINSHQRTQPALALEAIFGRDDLLQAAGVTPSGSELAAQAIWNQTSKVFQVIEQMPAAKHKRTLQSFQECYPERWGEMLLAGFNNMSAKVCTEVAEALMYEGKPGSHQTVHGERLAQLKDTVARLVSQHQASTEMLVWLAKERSDAFADILGPEVFRAMLTAMERDQFNEKKSNKLRDIILDDHDLLVEMIGAADLEVIKDLTRALQLSPCYDDMDKRSLLARIVKSYPAMQALISGEQTKQEAHLVVSWESLERRKGEYQELVQRKIPANSKEIAIARSYGDLRENHEYKSAKEMQKILMRRKAELETQLVRARGTDFVNPRTDAVSIGTRVVVTDLESGQTETFELMGAWDGDPDKGIISYLSPVAQSLLSREVGAEVEFEHHGSKRRYRVESIEAVKAAPGNGGGADEATGSGAEPVADEPAQTPA